MLQKIERSEGHQRLARLAQYLRDLDPNEKFDMNLWHCCALGHATHIPEFRNAGLWYDGNTQDVRYGTHFGHSAGAAFFNLTSKQSFDLFAYSSNKDGSPMTPADEANRIDQLLDQLALEAAAQ